ncbi:bifunctional metallophosphatase/5'-nucleotidase [Shumkonia mesophila]|uniref:bifunctional metallophosphatase/5'-nucleotidase n=1 Tax=Shumkonia mesophila TaxID=2838854 RepID=UPI002934C71B|nr:5'-nucleotidase C-terminal domain-containing protein [Shumkonia mesophila]
MSAMTFVRRWLPDAAVIAAVAAVLLAVPAMAEPTRITFLHTNDVYEMSPKQGIGGLAELMTLVRAERTRNANSITTFGGDLISPSMSSSVTKGAHMIELMNAIGVDVAVLGNHEFDFGPEVAAQRIGESKFPWLGTNVLAQDSTPAVGAKDILMLKKGSFTIGFFGALVPDTEVLSSPGKNIIFADVVESAEAAVKRLKESGADLIVAVTHLDIDQDRDLAASVGGINMILGGHDHDPITFYEKGVLIHKSGYNAHFLAAIDLSLDWQEKGGKRSLRVRPAWRMISTAGVAPDPEIKKLIDRHNASLTAELASIIGKTTVMLDTRQDILRSQETGFGNLVADAMKEAAGADVALVNSGAIRGDRTYESGTSLTRKDILNELPFDNVTVVVELAGIDLLAALENGVSKVEEKAARFPQVAGMSFVYDAKAPVGRRIVSAMVGGEALHEDRIYRVATNEFLAAGGDGYDALANGDLVVDASAGTYVATAVIGHILAKKSLAPRVEGRIRRR